MGCGAFTEVNLCEGWPLYAAARRSLPRLLSDTKVAPEVKDVLGGYSVDRWLQAPPGAASRQLGRVLDTCGLLQIVALTDWPRGRFYPASATLLRCRKSGAVYWLGAVGLRWTKWRRAAIWRCGRLRLLANGVVV